MRKKVNCFDNENRKSQRTQSLPGPWAAPIFAAGLSAITISVFLLIKPHSYEAGFPAFFCFLPLAFYFGATAQIESQKQVRALQLRIEQLEAQATNPFVERGT